MGLKTLTTLLVFVVPGGGDGVESFMAQSEGGQGLPGYILVTYQ